MDSALTNRAGGTLVSREDLINLIKESSRELRLLGTLSFNLPWNEENLGALLLDKYISNNSQYEITIVAESDPSLQSYALTSSLAGDVAGVPIAMLEEIRQNSTLRLREKFIQAKAAGIEPVEDKYRQELDSLYSRRFAQNICKELIGKKHSFTDFFGESCTRQGQSILDRFFTNCLQMAESAFQKSEIAKYYLGKGDYFNIGKQSANFLGLVETRLRASLEIVSNAEQDGKTDALFDFCDNGINIEYDDNASRKNCLFKVEPKSLRTICVDSFLHGLELFEMKNFDLIKDFASKEAYVDRMSLQSEFKEDSKKKQRLFIKQVFHPIPVQMLMVDGQYFASISPLAKNHEDQYLYLGDSNKTVDDDVNRFSRFDDYVQYFDAYLNSQYCTEETKKGNKKEVIYNYTSNHAIIGQMPRDSFYGSDNYKLVMWALVFDRKGRILIHRRANNAKDNQGLWDKSVGGHIAITDRDTIAGAAREIAEELYNVEEEEQSHTHTTAKFNDVKSDEIIYLGKWKESRYPNFGSSLNLESNEFYLFSFESRMTEQPIDSMRILPNGTRIKAKCFADLYFTITSKNFDLSELQNSKYLVLPPQLIKRCAKLKVLSPEIRQEIQIQNPNIDLNDISDHFDVTPDLEYLINSPEWDDEITKFSIRVREAFA